LPRLILVAVGLWAGCGDDNVAHVDAAVDSGSPDAFGVCNPVSQDCPSGQRCTLNHAQPVNMLYCEPTAGTATEFQACTPNEASDDCVRGTVCLTTGTNFCRKFCGNDNDCGNNNTCAIPIEGTPLYACAQHCTVLAQDCTLSGEACYLGRNAAGGTTQQCSPEGNLTSGTACSRSNDCQRGLLCVMTVSGDAGTGFFCRAACNPSQGSSCGTTETCTGFVSTPGLGYCRPN
jgi:hypothetical protein